MRIFWYNKDNNQDPLTLLHDTEPPIPSKPLLFPTEIIQKIIDYLPRSSLPTIASVCQIWYTTAMPVLYRQFYVRTLPHWLLLVQTFSNEAFAFGHCVTSLVLKPSPKLISAQLTSYLNQQVVVNDDILQPNTRGYVRIERVNFELNGLEGIEIPQSFEQGPSQHENYREIDDTKKEYEWLTHVTSDQVATVLRKCPALEYLNLSGCENLQDSVLLALVKGKQEQPEKSRPMKGIWISLLRELTPYGISTLIKYEKTRFPAPEEKKMKHLDLGYNIIMSKQTLQEIFKTWGKTLTHVRLDTIYEVSDETLQVIATHCPNLVLLHLTRCWSINNSALKILAQHCKQLKYVSLAFLSQVNEEGVKYLVQMLPELVWLDITGCGINTLFKTLILESFVNYRRQHALPPIYMQDGTVNLI